MNHKHTVLVVDDEPDIVKSLENLLRLEYRVLGATSAAEGLEILEREDVQVVLTDQRMPGMDGVEFLRQILEPYPDTMRLLLTGYTDLQTVIAAINIGHVHSYVAKPWNADELQKLVFAACEHYDLNLEFKCILTELQQKNQALRKTRRGSRHAAQPKNLDVQAVGHEFRNLLSVVLMLAQLTLRTAKLPREAVRYLRRIDVAARRLELLIQQLDTAATPTGDWTVPNFSSPPHNLPALTRLAAPPENISNL